MIVNEGYREASYVLDEALIRFGTALDDGEYDLAVSILEPLEVTPEVGSRPEISPPPVSRSVGRWLIPCDQTHIVWN